MHNILYDNRIFGQVPSGEPGLITNESVAIAHGDDSFEVENGGGDVVSPRSNGPTGSA